nr:MAG TPA: major capsid protein [Caudoviricetes sp.]
MTDFKPIETQEEFDSMIAERLKRERETVAKKFGDYESLKEKAGKYDSAVSDYEEKIKKLNNDLEKSKKSVQELQDKNAKYETDSAKTRIAQEYGIPYEMAGRLTGTDEESIRRDAEAFAKSLSSARKSTAPLRSTEDPLKDTKDEAYLNLAKSLTKE